MICHHSRTNQSDFGSDQVKGQDPGHKKVKNVFLSSRAQFSSDSYETNAKMFNFQFPILRYDDKCGVGERMCSTEWFVCMYACYQLFSKTTGPNCMKLSRMICHHPRTN